MFNIWREKPPGLGVSFEGNPDLESVRKCMQVLKVAEEQWHMAGRFGDLLHELTSIRDPLLSTQTAQARKPLVSTEQEGPYGHGVPPQAKVAVTELTDHGSPCDYQSSTHCLMEGSYATPHIHQSLTESLQLRPFDYNCLPSSVQQQLQVPIRHISHSGSHARESQQPQANRIFSDEVMDMWSNAPTGFGLDDWDVYLGGFPNANESHWHTLTS
ncbi:unnamed protein product [Cyclocybe aegerita]|uniref:Uncharacterized protein n=1 Tax=Cyclocybe aegerita TaxID=1973307 RepID=A0A8S0VVZ1_CYCAE|nr:unnamed protein product [Cyclocybe aegerita]